MTEYADLLKKLEEDVSAIKDEGLRRIAFERLLQNELSARTRGADNADIKSKPNDAVHAAAKSTK